MRANAAGEGSLRQISHTLIRRISSHHKKIGAGFKAAVARARRQNRDVSRRYHHFMAVLAAEHQPRVTAGKAEHLVGRRMVMMKVIHTIPPLRGPSVLTECGLHLRSQLFGRSLGHCAINQNRKIRIIRHPAIT